MGTRADFYAGKGPDAEWLGSIAFDGYFIAESSAEDRDPEGRLAWAVKSAKSEDEYRKAVAALLDALDDATLPKDGWPWPWADSGTTDCHYWFFDDQCWYGSFDRGASSIDDPEPDEDDEPDAHAAWLTRRITLDFPDMSSRKNVTFGKRSGLMIFSA